MTVNEYRNKLKRIDAAYVKLRTELDEEFLNESEVRLNIGDVVSLESITNTYKLIVDEVKVLVDENDEPDVYVTRSRFALEPEKEFFYKFRCRDAKLI